MDQLADGAHKVAAWDFAPNGDRCTFLMTLTPSFPTAGGPAQPRRFVLTHDQALSLALRIAHRLRD